MANERRVDRDRNVLVRDFLILGRARKIPHLVCHGGIATRTQPDLGHFQRQRDDHVKRIGE